MLNLSERTLEILWLGNIGAGILFLFFMAWLIGYLCRQRGGVVPKFRSRFFACLTLPVGAVMLAGIVLILPAILLGVLSGDNSGSDLNLWIGIFMGVSAAFLGIAIWVSETKGWPLTLKELWLTAFILLGGTSSFWGMHHVVKEEGEFRKHASWREENFRQLDKAFKDYIEHYHTVPSNLSQLADADLVEKDERGRGVITTSRTFRDGVGTETLSRSLVLESAVHYIPVPYPTPHGMIRAWSYWPYPEAARNRVIVLYGNGRIEWLDLENFMQTLDETNRFMENYRKRRFRTSSAPAQ